MLLAHRVGKHTKKRKKRLDRARAKLREKDKKKSKNPDLFDTAALHLLHDPQGFAERLMAQVEKTTERFEVPNGEMSIGPSVCPILSSEDVSLASTSGPCFSLVEEYSRKIFWLEGNVNFWFISHSMVELKRMAWDWGRGKVQVFRYFVNYQIRTFYKWCKELQVKWEGSQPLSR